MALEWSAGELVTADKLNARLPILVQKGESESITSSTAFQNDDSLVLTLPANRTYEISAVLSPVSSASGGDFKCDWVVSGTVAQATTRKCTGPGVNTTDATATAAAATTVGVNRATSHNLTTSVAYGLDGSNASTIRENFLVTTGASGGTLQFRWAQNTSNATAVTMSPNSYIVALPVD